MWVTLSRKTVILQYVGIIFNSTGIRQNNLHYAGILSSLTDPYISSKLCQNPEQKVIRFLTLYETQATYSKKTNQCQIEN